MTIRTLLLVLALLSLGSFTYAQFRDDSGADPPIQLGKPGAKFQIEVFIDLQCPSCADFSKILRSVETKHPGELLITFRHFPLAISAHDKAYEAAKFLEAAHHQQKGVEMLDMLLTNQKAWTYEPTFERIFRGYAKKLGLKMKQFETDLNSMPTLTRIEQDIARAKALKLNSTPSVLLNNKLLTYTEALDIEALITKTN